MSNQNNNNSNNSNNNNLNNSVLGSSGASNLSTMTRLDLKTKAVQLAYSRLENAEIRITMREIADIVSRAVEEALDYNTGRQRLTAGLAAAVGSSGTGASAASSTGANSATAQVMQEALSVAETTGIIAGAL